MNCPCCHNTLKEGIATVLDSIKKAIKSLYILSL